MILMADVNGRDAAKPVLPLRGQLLADYATGEGKRSAAVRHSQIFDKFKGKLNFQKNEFPLFIIVALV